MTRARDDTGLYPGEHNEVRRMLRRGLTLVAIGDWIGETPDQIDLSLWNGLGKPRPKRRYRAPRSLTP